MNVIPQRVRDGFGKLIEPLAVVFIRLHIRPNLITTVGTLVVIASATAFGLGWVRSGGLLLLVSGVFDLLDGRVARRADMTTTFGAFYDSTLDRVGEAALFGGIALYFLRGGVPPERLTFAVVACLVALAASLIVSYTRARAEGLGLTAKVGIAQRAERVLLLGVPTVFFGAGNHGALLFWIVVVLALATSVTVVQRVLYVARVAGEPAVRRPPRQRKTGRDARGAGCGLHDVHRGRRERAPGHRTADRLAVANRHHPPREAHREAEPENQGIRAAHRLDGLGVRRLGPDSR